SRSGTSSRRRASRGPTGSGRSPPARGPMGRRGRPGWTRPGGRLPDVPAFEFSSPWGRGPGRAGPPAPGRRGLGGLTAGRGMEKDDAEGRRPARATQHPADQVVGMNTHDFNSEILDAKFYIYYWHRDGLSTWPARPAGAGAGRFVTGGVRAQRHRTFRMSVRLAGKAAISMASWAVRACSAARATPA